MSNSIPVGKKIVISIAISVIAFLIIHFIGLGLSNNGAVALALGLFIGTAFGSQIVESLSSLTKHLKRPARKKVVVSSVGDNEILSIFVGNLAFKVRGRQLAELFEPYGPIESIRIVKDRNTGRGKGFGFVDMKGAAAKKAIAELDGSEFFGRMLKVSEANAQKLE